MRVDLGQASCWWDLQWLLLLVLLVWQVRVSLHRLLVLRLLVPMRLLLGLLLLQRQRVVLLLRR